MPLSSHSRRSLLLLLGLAAGALALWIAGEVVQPQRWIVARLAAELPDTPPAELSTKLEQIAAFGEAGVPHLARAMKHASPAIAGAARGVLASELDRWQMLSQAEASRRLAILAHTLAEDIEQSEAATRRVCGDFATRLLLWPVDASAVNPAQIIADCEHVLLSVREEPTATDRNAAKLAGAAFVPTPGNMKSGPLTPLDETLAIPGGALPFEAITVPALPPGERVQPQTLPIDHSPHLSPVVNPADEPRHLPDLSQQENYHEVLASAREEETIKLVQQLVARVSFVRDAAEEVLRERGFGEAHLAVARKFADPRSEVRLRLVEQLAQQQVVDGKPWLLRLLEDREPQVRLAAAKVLVTTGDAYVAKRLRERSLQESHPEVKAILER